MPAESIAVRQVREILRLIAVEKLAVRDVARRTGKAPSSDRRALSVGPPAPPHLLQPRGDE